MKWLDTPPVWLLATIALAWALARLAPGLGFGGWADWAGAVLILAGVAAMVLAVLEFRRVGTSIVPHEVPSAMITTGIYRFSRNPIYLGDTLILTGVVLILDAVLALPLVPIFAWILLKRFVEPEERRLEDAFAGRYRDWAERTRRWI